MQRLKTARGSSLEEILNKLQVEYSALFEILAPSLFQPMIDGVDKATERWFPTVEPTAATRNAFDQAYVDNMKAVKHIPEDYFDRIRETVRTNPGDTQALTTELSTIGAKSMRQAKNAAIGLTRDLYQTVAIEKAKSTGATIGIWHHSHGSKDPRHQHEQCDGEEFDLNTLLFLTGPLKGKGAGETDHDNKPVRPGEAYGCKCTFRLKIDFGVQ